jgi:hypothetical protein
MKILVPILASLATAVAVLVVSSALMLGDRGRSAETLAFAGGPVRFEDATPAPTCGPGDGSGLAEASVCSLPVP